MSVLELEERKIVVYSTSKSSVLVRCLFIYGDVNGWIFRNGFGNVYKLMICSEKNV